MKVLHMVDMFLPVTENWIYPQVIGCNAETAVLCRQAMNLSDYPLRGSPLFVKGLGARWSAAGPLEGPMVWANRAKSALAVIRAYYWRPNLIHAHFGSQGWHARRLRRALNVPLVTSFYGFDAWLLPAVDSEWKRKFRELFRYGSAFLVEGPAMRQRLVALGCEEKKVRICSLSIDPASLSWHEPDPNEDLKIIMVGRFVEKKGMVDGLRACAVAASNGIPLRLTIVGDASEATSDQTIKRELQAIAARPELAGRVRFAGFLPHAETLSLMAAHNVLLCPSRHASSGDAEGGLPFVLPEGIAMGLVAIGARHCDIPEAIADGESGFLFEEGNVPELAAKLADLSRAPARRVSMSRIGRRLIEDKFNRSQQVAMLEETYRELLSS